MELTGNPDIEIKRIEYDSRLVDRDCLFVAVKGYKSDGYDFVEEARRKGAVAVIGERKKCEAPEAKRDHKKFIENLAEKCSKFEKEGKHIVTGTESRDGGHICIQVGYALGQLLIGDPYSKQKEFEEKNHATKT